MVQRSSITWLRWVLSTVIFLEALRCLFSTSTSPHLGLPHWVAPVICGGEVLAVLLFSIPAVSRKGGYLLLFILAIAILIHVLHGELDVGALVVYGMATIACMSPALRVAHE